MATKSGMNYDKVEKLIEYLDSQKTSIINNLTDLSNEAPSKIAAHYSGQAAETYKNTLTDVITKFPGKVQFAVRFYMTDEKTKAVKYILDTMVAEITKNVGN